MAHFANVQDGVVTQVIVAEQDFIDSGAVGDPSNWIQTSYNTRGGVHYSAETGEPDGGEALRANYASIGGVYDASADVFYDKKPYESWTLEVPSYRWIPPQPYPDVPVDDVGSPIEFYTWDEDQYNSTGNGWKPLSY